MSSVGVSSDTVLRQESGDKGAIRGPIKGWSEADRATPHSFCGASTMLKLSSVARQRAVAGEHTERPIQPPAEAKRWQCFHSDSYFVAHACVSIDFRCLFRLAIAIEET